MTCEKPILTVNLKGIAEIIRDGRSGFLFNPDDGNAFTRHLHKLAIDRALRQQLGQESRRVMLETCNLSIACDHATAAFALAVLRHVSTTTEDT